MKLIFILLIIFVFSSFADSGAQTDWSGGPGIWGPVLDFGFDFHNDSGIEHFSSSPGDISLDMVIYNMGHNVTESFDGARAVHSADFDGDGDMDIVGGCRSGPPDICWWENMDGAGTAWIEHTVAVNSYLAYSVYSEDIDSDGDMDILGTSSHNDQIAWWENENGSGSSWVKHIVVDNYDFANFVYSEDIDGDGDPDIIGCSFEGFVTWWENLDGSAQSWTRHDIDSNFGAARCVYSEDVDGDGDMDVLGAGTGTITWWDNLDGSGTSWNEKIIGSGFQNSYSVYAKDMDGDGDIDALGASNASSVDYDITWWENIDGSGRSWTMHIVDGDFWGARSVYAEDIDRDGDMDILGASYNECDIAWWENLNGSCTEYDKHLIIDGDFAGATSVYMEDINGDGIKDVIGAGLTWDLITWWDAVTYPPEGSLISSVLDTGCSPLWNTIDWYSTEPLGTSLGFQVRSSSDPDSSAMGSWSDTLYSPCSLEGLLVDEERYVQYRAILETSDLDTTAVLHDVTLSWNPLGISGDGVPETFELLSIYPNPSPGSPSVMFAVPECSSVGISIYDLSGRMVSNISTEEYSPGYHTVTFNELSPGIYFCRISYADVTSTRSFVVTE